MKSAQVYISDMGNMHMRKEDACIENIKKFLSDNDIIPSGNITAPRNVFEKRGELIDILRCYDM